MSVLHLPVDGDEGHQQGNRHDERQGVAIVDASSYLGPEIRDIVDPLKEIFRQEDGGGDQQDNGSR